MVIVLLKIKMNNMGLDATALDGFMSGETQLLIPKLSEHFYII